MWYVCCACASIVCLQVLGACSVISVQYTGSQSPMHENLEFSCLYAVSV